MAKKPSIEAQKSANVAKNGRNDVQFLNYTFNKDESERYKKWRDEQTIETLNECIEGLCDHGYSISIKWDNFNDCYACFITQPKSDVSPQSVILTGRGKSGVSAALGAIFRHIHVFEGVWPVETVAKRGTDDD